MLHLFIQLYQIQIRKKKCKNSILQPNPLIYMRNCQGSDSAPKCSSAHWLVRQRPLLNGAKNQFTEETRTIDPTIFHGCKCREQDASLWARIQCQSPQVNSSPSVRRRMVQQGEKRLNKGQAETVQKSGRGIRAETKRPGQVQKRSKPGKQSKNHRLQSLEWSIKLREKLRTVLESPWHQPWQSHTDVAYPPDCPHGRK